MGLFDAIGDAFSSAANAVGDAVSGAASAVGHAAEDVAGAAEDVGHAAESFASDTFSVIKTAADWSLNAVENAATDVEHVAEDAAKGVGGFIGKAAKYVGGLVSNAADGVWNGVKDFADGVAGAVTDVAVGLSEGVGGFFSNLVKGNVADAFGSLAQGLDKAFIQGPQRLWNGMLDGVQGVLDGASQLLPGFLGDAARQVIDRGADIVRTAGNTLFEAARDVYHIFTDTPINFAKDMWKVAGDLVHGKFGDAAKDFGGAFLHAGETIVGGVFDAVVRTLQGVASIAQTATGLEPPSRKLTDQEKATLRQIYGDSVDLDAIRIKTGGALDNAMAPHTVGNMIYMPKTNGSEVLLNPDGSLTADGLKTLVHETCHVWQSQNGGGKYIAESLIGQALEQIQGKSRNADYDWYNKAPATPFDQLNPEQQAAYVEDVIYPAMQMPGDFATNVEKVLEGFTADDGTKPVTGPYAVAYAQQALDDIHDRTGMA